MDNTSDRPNEPPPSYNDATGEPTNWKANEAEASYNTKYDGYPSLDNTQQQPPPMMVQQQGPPMGQQMPIQQTTVVMAAGNCPKCHVGNIVENFSCCGICCAIIFFPIGLICLFTMKDRICSHCGFKADN